MAEPAQLDLFADVAWGDPLSDAAIGPRLAPESLSDSDLIAALPDARLADACALAAEAGRRRLSGAVAALTALCEGFVGFGADREVPEQAAALEAFAGVGGPEAARAVGEMILRGIVQGPTLAVAMVAASRLGVTFPTGFALRLLRDSNPSVRASACACVRAGPEIATALIGLLVDRDREVSIAAACALGRMGRAEARDRLKRCLNECPSPRVIEGMAGIADDEAVVFLARVGRARSELAASVLSALDEIDLTKAGVAASGLRLWLSNAEQTPHRKTTE